MLKKIFFSASLLFFCTTFPSELLTKAELRERMLEHLLEYQRKSQDEENIKENSVPRKKQLCLSWQKSEHMRLALEAANRLAKLQENTE